MPAAAAVVVLAAVAAAVEMVFAVTEMAKEPGDNCCARGWFLRQSGVGRNTLAFVLGFVKYISNPTMVVWVCVEAATCASAVVISTCFLYVVHVPHSACPPGHAARGWQLSHVPLPPC